MEEFYKCWKLSLDKLRFQWKIALMMVIMLTMSLSALGMMFFYHKLYDYSENSCRAVLSEALENAGLIYIKGGGYQSREARRFLKSAVEYGTVKAIGCMEILRVDRLPELQKLQAGNEKREKQGLLRWIYMDETFLYVCDLKFAELLDDPDGQEAREIEMRGETHFSLYLGNHFREIPVGTCYRERISEEETYVYEVKGILEKGQCFVSPEIVKGTGAGSSNATISLDNEVIFCGEVSPPSAFWMYLSPKGADTDNTKVALKKLAREMGLKVTISGLKENFDFARRKGGQLQAVFGKLFVILFMATLVNGILLFLTFFVKNARDYGILHADGFSAGELGISCLLENAMQCILAFFLAGSMVWLAGMLLFGSKPEGAEMVNDIFLYSLLPIMTCVVALILFLLSVIPVILLNIAEPIMLLKGERL